ncbi:MAG: NADPH-dependent FMN reductase [Alphaproteobacteria bacterium]
MRTTIIYGSHRENRLGINAVMFFQKLLTTRGQHVDVIDSLQENLPVLDKRYMDYEAGKAPTNLERLAEIYRKSDGFLVVAGEYNHTIQPGLKNLLDYFYTEYFHRPAGIVSYSIGDGAGQRAAMTLRPNLAALGMVTIPKMCAIGKLGDKIDANGKPLTDSMASFGERFIDEFEWYQRALKNAHKSDPMT